MALKASEKEDHRPAGEIILVPGTVAFYVHCKGVCVCECVPREHQCVI